MRHQQMPTVCTSPPPSPAPPTRTPAGCCRHQWWTQRTTPAGRQTMTHPASSRHTPHTQVHLPCCCTMDALRAEQDLVQCTRDTQCLLGVEGTTYAWMLCATCSCFPVAYMLQCDTAATLAGWGGGNTLQCTCSSVKPNSTMPACKSPAPLEGPCVWQYYGTASGMGLLGLHVPCLLARMVQDGIGSTDRSCRACSRL